jgi:hypothetical protein
MKEGKGPRRNKEGPESVLIEGRKVNKFERRVLEGPGKRPYLDFKRACKGPPMKL